MKRKKPEKKLTFIFIALLIALLGSALSWRLWQSYTSRIWNYSGRLNLLEADGLTLISIPDTQGELLEIKLSKEAFVQVPGGYGDYRLGNVKELGETEDRSSRRGEDLLIKTVSQVLGVPVDGEVKALILWDKIKIWLIKRRLERRVKKINLSKLPIFLEEERADGSKIKKLAPEKIDFYLGEIFWEKTLREENLTIGVFNASVEPGLANQAARLLENIGGRVVEVANWQEEISFCQIKTQEKFKKSVTVVRLQKVFSCGIIFEEIGDRFDLILIVREPI